MGQTTSDRNKTIYSKWRNEGLSHEEAINKVPKAIRDRFIKDIEMSATESHFGVQPKTLLIIIGLIVLVGIALIII